MPPGACLSLSWLPGDRKQRQSRAKPSVFALSKYNVLPRWTTTPTSKQCQCHLPAEDGSTQLTRSKRCISAAARQQIVRPARCIKRPWSRYPALDTLRVLVSTKSVSCTMHVVAKPLTRFMTWFSPAADAVLTYLTWLTRQTPAAAPYRTVGASHFRGLASVLPTTSRLAAHLDNVWAAMTQSDGKAQMP